MKVGLFNPYLDTMGGGERYFLTAAQFFVDRGDGVEIVWNKNWDKTALESRFNLKLSGVKTIETLESSKYDLLFFVSDGSVPLSWAKRTWIHFQVPFNNPNFSNLANKLKFFKVEKVICNSYFTKKIIDQSYSVNSTVVYPPVDIESFRPGKKENIILSVGRFFAPSHPKKQEILIREFVSMYKSGLRNWKLVLVGGTTLGTEVTTLRKKCAGYPITIVTDADFKILTGYYAKAKIYWHAAGFGENLERYPDRAEHFGISTVEAMAAGCVPLVFSGGGQREIVQSKKNGYLWSSLEELAGDTINVVSNENLRSEIASNAVMRARDFSQTNFYKKLSALL